MVQFGQIPLHPRPPREKENDKETKTIALLTLPAHRSPKDEGGEVGGKCISYNSGCAAHRRSVLIDNGSRAVSPKYGNAVR
jgi:hypothetical protein